MIVAIGCGGPQIQSLPDYDSNKLEGHQLLVVPLAVSDELGDERTGVVLSYATAVSASRAACQRLGENTTSAGFVCPDTRATAKDSSVSKLQKLFALDEEVPLELLTSIRRASRADYALLFRPESVSSSREVSKTIQGKGAFLVGGSGGTLAVSGLVSALLVGASTRYVRQGTTDVEYTLSGALIDLQSGKLLRVGVHSDGASRTVNRDLGYAEPPATAPLLEDIMVTLGDALVD